MGGAEVTLYYLSIKSANHAILSIFPCSFLLFCLFAHVLFGSALFCQLADDLYLMNTKNWLWLKECFTPPGQRIKEQKVECENGSLERNVDGSEGCKQTGGGRFNGNEGFLFG